MEVSVKTLSGKDAGKIALDDAIFGIEEIRGDLLQRTVRWQLARRQAGTHKVKSRAEVNRTTKKSIKQKGSGGARHGSRNAPIFVGGGIAHGPRVRSHAIGLNKKIRKLALAHALSSKVRERSIMVLDEAKLSSPKTKELVSAFKGLGIENALIISGTSVDENFGRAAMNIPNVDVLPVAGLNVYDILRRKTLVITKEAAEGIKARFAAPVQKDA
jgi:large subunit ribosomal protein L4